MPQKREAFPDYGYRINVNEPPYDELFERFKKYKGIPRWCPLSDGERQEFESYFIKGDDNNQP